MSNSRTPFKKASQQMAERNGLPGFSLLGPDGQPTNVRIAAAQLATPFNDTQLLCLMAATIEAAEPERPEESSEHRADRIADRTFELFASVVCKDKGGRRAEVFESTRKRLFGDPRDEEEQSSAGPIVPGGSGL